MSCYFSWRCLFLVLCVLRSMFWVSFGCLMEERTAVMHIRTSLMSVNSTVPNSWGRGDDCCSWERIRCNNSTRRISHLDLSYVCYSSNECWNLSMTIFSSFHELQLLDLSRNGACPLNFEGLQGLSKLQYLNLSENSLMGTIPGSLSKLVSLEVIDLDGNGINGTLQDTAFRNLVNLRELHLGSNSLSGSLPASLFALPRLEYLDLSYNLFEGHLLINSSWNLEGNNISGALQNTAFRNLVNLRRLNLKSNQLSGSLPASLFALPRLKYLDLSKNRFLGHLPINSSSNLDGNNISGPLQSTAFRNLVNLRRLDLRSNQLSGSLPASLFALPRLEYLDLSENFFQGHLPINSSWNLDGNNTSGALQDTALRNLVNLRELHMRWNQLSGSLPASLFALPRLEYLDLSENRFLGHIPINSSWNCLSLLQALKLNENNLSGKFDFFWLRCCTELKNIDLSGNAIQVEFPAWVPPFQLKILRLSGCSLDKSIIRGQHFLGTQHHLKILDLSNNNLPGSILHWLFTNNSALNYLDSSNNLLVGSIDPIWPQRPNYNLSLVNMSMNHIDGQLPANISSVLPNLRILDISHNVMSGVIPPSLCSIGRMEFMDLSNNKFTGEVPACLYTDCSTLMVLKLSNNNLGGLILGGASNLSFLWEIHLDSNKFEGTLPRNLSGHFFILDLHDNKMSGELDTLFWNLSSLEALNLASNSLTGKIRPEICNLTDLLMLDLSDNSFAGPLPICDTTLQLSFLNMSGNSLSGSPNAFFNCSDITALDLRYNQFTGNLAWIQYLSEVGLLLLGWNKFEGQIYSSLCQLQYVSIIDFSHNRLSGSIPPCIGDIPFEDRGDYRSRLLWPSDSPCSFAEDFDGMDIPYECRYDMKGFTFDTKGNLYTYGINFFNLMSGIDLSANKLSGEIPWEIGNLSHIKSLNLSNNLFTGPIPASLANMSEIESLDLSHNRLNGPIPWQLTRLSSLEVFSVAYNDLSGCVPYTGQLGTFDMDSYKGNNNLLNASPGSRSCTSSSGPVASSDRMGTAPDDSDPILDVVRAVSFVLTFWATVAFLFCHSFGQRVILNI